MELRNKKTGKRGTLALNNSEGEIEIVVLEPDMPLCGNSVLARYDSLAELNKDWEDYEPVGRDLEKTRSTGKPRIDANKVNELIGKIHPEPRIEDEQVRKLVKDWAISNNIHEVFYDKDKALLGTEDGCKNICIGWLRRENLEDGHLYTIAELCGEEE